MTFESFDAAPLIENGGFVPAMTEASAPDTITLDAALREAARAEMRAEASILDLWVERPGASTFRVLEGPAFMAGTSRHAWAVMAGDDGALIFPPNGNDTALRAAFGDDDWDEEEGIVVVGPSIDEGDDDGSYTGGNYGDGSYPGGPEGPAIGEGGPTLQPGEKPSCATSNEITNKDAPDGAGKYYAPEGVNAAYLNGALNHIIGISNNNPLNRFAVMQEIIDMYTNPDHPYFVDFKDWGSANGPDGSIGVTWTYFSQAVGAEVTGSLFEPFGNYFFGMLCTYGGLSPEEIYAAAAWYSESGPFWEGDDPQDIPHVQLGMADARRKIDAQTPGIPNTPPIEVNDQCGS